MKSQVDGGLVFMSLIGLVIVFFLMSYVYKGLISWWFEVKYFMKTAKEMNDNLKRIADTLDKEPKTQDDTNITEK